MQNELFKAVKKVGMQLASLSREIGVDKSTISGWSIGRHTPETYDSFLALKKRATYLAQISMADCNFDFIREELGISISAVAKELGISPQALWEQLQKEINCRRKREIEGVLRGMGRTILALLRKV